MDSTRDTDPFLEIGQLSTVLLSEMLFTPSHPPCMRLRSSSSSQLQTEQLIWMLISSSIQAHPKVGAGGCSRGVWLSSKYVRGSSHLYHLEKEGARPDSREGTSKTGFKVGITATSASQSPLIRLPSIITYYPIMAQTQLPYILKAPSKWSGSNRSHFMAGYGIRAKPSTQ